MLYYYCVFSLHETCSKDRHHFLDYRNESMWLCEVFCVRQCNRLPKQKCGAPKKPYWGQPCSVWKGDCWLKIQVMLSIKKLFETKQHFSLMVSLQCYTGRLKIKSYLIFWTPSLLALDVIQSNNYHKIIPNDKILLPTRASTFSGFWECIKWCDIWKIYHLIT